MAIGLDEIDIIGSWVVVNGRTIEDEASRRISALIKKELQHVATAKDGWEKLYRDSQDGRYWELTYPHGEMQSGGPPALHVLSQQSVQQKYGDER
jgi:hypothetical protein